PRAPGREARKVKSSIGCTGFGAAALAPCSAVPLEHSQGCFFMAQAAPRRHGAVLGACATTILLPRRRPPGSLGARPRSWDGPEALELVQFSGFLRKKSGRSLRGTCACRVIRAVVHPMVERDPCDSTVRSNQGGLRSRENIERGIMWLAPRQWFLPFESKRVVLGRGEDCTHVLPGAEVSRYHAEVVPEGGIVWLRDLRSTDRKSVV